VFWLIAEVTITVPTLDLAGVLAMSGQAVGVLSHAGWIGDG